MKKLIYILIILIGSILNVESQTISFTLSSGSPFTAGTNPIGMATGDFNGDGNADMAIVNNGSNTISILLGQGNGNFVNAPGSPLSINPVRGVPQGPISVVTADFNGDGFLDLAVANLTGSSMSVYLGGGNGTYPLINSSYRCECTLQSQSGGL